MTCQLQLNGNFFPEINTNTNDELFAYGQVLTRKIVCDLIRNKKFNIQRYPSALKVRFMWNIGIFCHALDILLFLFYMIPVLVVSSIAGLIGIIGGKTTIRYYNLTISENFFNLDHDRIQNDIEPRSNEMSSAQLLKEVGNSTIYEDRYTVFAFTDFLCYASGTRHFTQKDKNYRKKRNKKIRI